MLCALTVRQLKPGTFEDFRREFMADMAENPPAGWVRFNMIRNASDPDQVVCFGFFDGDMQQLRASAASEEYQDQQERIAPFVDSVGADGLFEIVEQFTTETARSS